MYLKWLEISEVMPLPRTLNLTRLYVIPYIRMNEMVMKKKFYLKNIIYKKNSCVAGDGNSVVRHAARNMYAHNFNF